MRRLLLSVAALVPLAVLVGCHEAGRCDCDHRPTIDCPCYSGHVPSTPPMAVAPVKVPEPLKEEPKPKSDTPEQ